MKIPLAVLFLGLLIFIHEFGHFFVAKTLGIGVKVLSLGFGRRLVGFRLGQTEYRVSLVPFGGYVRLHGADPFRDAEDPDDVRFSPSESVNERPIWQRFLVYAGGPIFNLVLPFFLFVGLLVSGQPEPASTVGTVVVESVAWNAGVRAGDRVESVDGAHVDTWNQIEEIVIARRAASEPLWLRVERPDGSASTLSLETPAIAPDPRRDDKRPVIEDFGLRVEVPGTAAGVDDPESPAGRAGIVTGDQVSSVDGVTVKDWLHVSLALEKAADHAVVSFRRDGTEHTAALTADPAWESAREAPSFPEIGPARWGLASTTLFVSGVSDNSSAQKAGVRAGDHILGVDGEPMGSWYEVLRTIGATSDEASESASVREVQLCIRRDGHVLQMPLQPAMVRDTDLFGRYYWRPVIGVIRMGQYARGPMVIRRYTLFEAVPQAGRETVGLVKGTVEQVGRIVTGQVAPQESLGGPVEIMRQASEAADEGWFYVVQLLGMISISVGVFNLLPVPLLDGGQLIFYAVEGVTGRPVSPVLREKAQIVGFMLLVALMLFVLVADVGRLFRGG
jgi:regulator of sigma E protease